MFSLIKKLFSRQKEEYFSFKQEPDFQRGHEFSKPDEAIAHSLKERLIELQNTTDKFVIEPPLKEKKVYEYINVQELVDKIIDDLESNYTDYSREFMSESMAFKYIIGSELLFKNSVEIVQRIFHLQRNDVGELYYSLVVKYDKGKYYYWTW